MEPSEPRRKKPIAAVVAAAALLLLFAVLLLVSYIRTSQGIEPPAYLESTDPSGSSSAAAGSLDPSGGEAASSTCNLCTEGVTGSASVPSGSGTTARAPSVQSHTTQATTRPTPPASGTGTSAKPTVTEEMRQAVRREVEEKYRETIAKRKAEYEQAVASIEQEKAEIVGERAEMEREVNRLYAQLGMLGTEKHRQEVEKARSYRQEDYECLNREREQAENEYLLWQEEMERTITQEVEEILSEIGE